MLEALVSTRPSPTGESPPRRRAPRRRLSSSGVFWPALACVFALLVAAPAAAVTYEYDALGRLVRVVYDDGASLEFAWDDNGNLLERKSVAGTPPNDTIFVDSFESGDTSAWSLVIGESSSGSDLTTASEKTAAEAER